MIRFWISAVLFFFSVNAFGQWSAQEILAKCIKKHDPKGIAPKASLDLDICIKRSHHPDRYFTIQSDVDHHRFSYIVKNDSVHYTQGIVNEKFISTINNKPPTQNEIEKYELTLSRTQYLKEVYEYLLYLPMRLSADAKLLQTRVVEVPFNQYPCYQLCVQYLPEHENETWLFFIDKHDFVLRGYQFYQKDITKDGEYIFLENYTNIHGIWMPMTKIWYWNKDHSLFRTDTILGYR
jgi:hypothetical protein